MLYRSMRKQGAGQNTLGAKAALSLVLLLLVSINPLGSRSRATTDREDANAGNVVRDDPALNVESFSTADPKISPDEESYFETEGAKDQKVVGDQYARAQAGSDFYYVASIEFDSARSCRNFRVPGTYVFNRFGKFADVFIRGGKKAAEIHARILRAPGVVWIETAKTAIVPPQLPARSTLTTRQPPEPIVRGGFKDLTGKGVIIAVIDSGADFRNCDFIKNDAAGRPISRLLAFLDLTSNAYHSLKLGSKPPFSYPNGVPFGTLYWRNQLTEALRSTSQIPATDLSGHGTACTSIAAGNGNNAPNNRSIRGVAPDADIISVRIGGGEGDRFDYAYMLNAIVGWLDKVAGERPLVVSCSFGNNAGGHDGQSVAERQLNTRFTPDRKGRVLVVAAGNEGTSRTHARVDFKDKHAAGWLRFTAAGPDAYVEVYFDSGDIKDLFVSPVNGSKDAWVNPLTKQVVMRIETPVGNGELRLFNLSGKPMKADAYIYKGEFKPGTFNYSTLISSPGATDNAITITSYDYNDHFSGVDRKDFCGNQMIIGSLSCYSSPGYGRLGVVKPDIAAPGQYYSASYARKPDGSGVNETKIEVDATGKYRLFSGTSAATPYTAGVMALIMQKKPAITLREVKEVLRRNATSNKSITGAVPNPKWGYGKLDLEAIERIIEAVN